MYDKVLIHQQWDYNANQYYYCLLEMRIIYILLMIYLNDLMNRSLNDALRCCDCLFKFYSIVMFLTARCCPCQIVKMLSMPDCQEHDKKES